MLGSSLTCIKVSSFWCYSNSPSEAALYSDNGLWRWCGETGGAAEHCWHQQNVSYSQERTSSRWELILYKHCPWKHKAIKKKEGLIKISMLLPLLSVSVCLLDRNTHTIQLPTVQWNFLFHNSDVLTTSVSLNYRRCFTANATMLIKRQENSWSSIPKKDLWTIQNNSLVVGRCCR